MITSNLNTIMDCEFGKHKNELNWEISTLEDFRGILESIDTSFYTYFGHYTYHYEYYREPNQEELVWVDVETPDEGWIWNQEVDRESTLNKIKDSYLYEVDNLVADNLSKTNMLVYKDLLLKKVILYTSTVFEDRRLESIFVIKY